MSGKEIQEGLKQCQHPGCEERFSPARANQAYCTEHRKPKWCDWRHRQKASGGNPAAENRKPGPTSSGPQRASTAGETRPATARRPAKRREEGLQPRGQGIPGLSLPVNLELTTAMLVNLLRAAADRLEEEGV